MMANLSDVPGVPTKLDQQLRSLLLSLREHVRQLRGYDGDKEARAVTLADLQTAVGTTIVVTNPGGGGGGTTPDYTPPPTPTGCVVVAGIDFLAYQTDAPTFTQGNGYARTRVYGAKWPTAQVDPPTRANAVLIDEFVGQVGSMPTDPATRWCVWLAWVTRDGVESSAAAGGTNGLQATTGQDVAPLLAALAGKVKNEQLDPASNFIFRANLFTIAPAAGGLPNVLPFSVLTAPTMTPAGELLPAGTYIDAAYIRNLEAALGRFQNAFITNAMIVSVSASRITSGVISVGNYIQSSNYTSGSNGAGWRINGDGTAELQAAYIRGKITANQMDTRDLVVRNTAGTPILGAGLSAGGGNLFKNAALKLTEGVRPQYLRGYSGQLNQSMWMEANGGAISDTPVWNIQALSDVVGHWGFEVLADGVAGGWPAAQSHVISFYAAASGQMMGKTFFPAWNTAPSSYDWIENYPLSSNWQRYSFRLKRSATSDSFFFAIGGLGAGSAGSRLVISNLQVEPGDAPSGWSMPGVSSLIPITASNVSTVIADAAIGTAQIGSLSVGVMSTAINGGSGIGVQLAGQRISVLDDSAVRRVRIGYLF